MSRSSVFSRIASWLKNSSNLAHYRRQKDAMTRMHRQYTVQNLEDRYMLDASFTYDDVLDELVLENFSQVISEGLEISETADDITFTLQEGTWSGTDDLVAGVEGDGTSILRVDKLGTADNLVQIDDGLGIDINFDTADYSRFDNFIINSSRGDITQTPLSQLTFFNFIVDGANNLELREIVNDFTGFVSITDTNFAKVRDGGELNLELIQINVDAEFENNGRLGINDNMTIGRDLLLNANAGDIRQEIDAPVVVEGKTRLKSNGGGVSAGAEIYLGFGDANGDGFNDNDFKGRVEILRGSNIDIRDKNDLLLGDATTVTLDDINQYYAEAEDGSIMVDGTILVEGDDANDLPGKFFMRATDGVSQTAQGILQVDDLILLGSGDFLLDGENYIFDNGVPRAGNVSVDVFGDLVLHNEEDLNFSANTFAFLSPGGTIDIRAAKTRMLADGSKGHMTIVTSNDNVTQSINAAIKNAPVIVEGLATFDTGTGNVTLNYGDELGDFLNDNNWSRIEIVSAGTTSFVDENEIVVGDINVANNARFQAENDKEIVADGLIVVGNNLLFQSDAGVRQTSGFINTSGLAVQGRGDFNFDLINEIGDAGTLGRVAADLEAGEFTVENLFGLQVTTITAFGETIVGIDGTQVDRTRLRGSEIAVDQVIDAEIAFLDSESTITQNSAIIAGQLMLRSNESTTLSAANLVDEVAAAVEGDFVYNNDIALAIAQLTFDGTTLVGVSVQNGTDNNFTLSTSDDDVIQNLDAPVVVDGILDIDLGLGCLAFAFGDGNTDSVNDNDFTVFVVSSALRVEIVDRNTITTQSIDVGEQILIESELGRINLEGNLTATNLVLLMATDGVQQNLDGLGNAGVIDTEALMLKGDGDFILLHDNEVGSPTTPGELAIDINGSFELNNVHTLATTSLTFERKDLSTITINGFNINTGGGALVLNVSGLTIENEIIAPKIIINTTGDIVQAPAGRFVTDELVLSGVGNFELNAMNQIGTAVVPGKLAINVEGDVELTNEFDLLFDEIICGPDTFLGVSLAAGVSSNGDLTIHTDNADIRQANESVATVVGTTTFDVGTGDVDLTGFVDFDNNFNIVRVDSGNDIELADADGLIVETSTVTNNFLVRSGETIPSIIDLDDNIVVGNQFLLDSQLGVTQRRGFITADKVLLSGSSDFDLLLGNQISNLAADVTGNISIHNETDLNVVKETYTTLGGTAINFDGVDVSSTLFDGNLNISTVNGNVTQDMDALVRVSETAAFDLGAGDLELNFGDSNSDALNDNDLNVLAIAAARVAEVTDQNSIGLDDINVSDRLFVEAEGGSISMQGIISADDQILFRSLTGVGTRIDALVDTDELILEGSGEFNLDGDNRIGSAAIPGKLAVDVTGDVIIHNTFGTHFDDLTFTQLGGVVTNIAGADVDVNGFDGNLFLKSEGGITDSDTVDILVDGHAAFISGLGSDVDLGGANMLTSTSIGLAGRNVTIVKDDTVLLDGVDVAGDLNVFSTGGFSQSAVDESGLAGTRFVQVVGDATFTVDSIGGGVEDLDVNLLSNSGNLLNNRFGGNVTIQGTSFLTTGNGQLGGVQFRNSIVDAALFPTINTVAGDRLSALTVWAPNSSLTITNSGAAGFDYDVMGNMTVFAGIDSETGAIGGMMKVTDNSQTRSLRDDSGVTINVDGNLFTNAANTLTLADSASNSVLVGGKLSLVNQGGANENRIRIGVGAGVRGDDSGALVMADTVRVRANRNGTDGHVTINIDNDIHFVQSNAATSLVAVADGHITDDVNAGISVANVAFFDADAGAGDVILGDDNGTNRTIFGSVGFHGNNVSFTEDTSALLNGSMVNGTFDALAKGSIRQTGVDRNGRAGTPFIDVTGDATFTVDGTAIPGDHLRDLAGKDVMLVANGRRDLMDNHFGGAIFINSTQHLSGGNGTLRNVGIRNMAMNAATPTFGRDDADPLKTLMLWTPNSSIDLTAQSTAIDYDIAGHLSLFAGLESTTGQLGGDLVIVDNAVTRDITDSGVSIQVGRNANLHAANSITLVDQANESLIVGRQTNLDSKGGLAGNAVNVGTSLTVRGDDSGGTFETRLLKFNIDDTGVGGELTVVADLAFNLDPTSSAPDVVLKP